MHHHTHRGSRVSQTSASSGSCDRKKDPAARRRRSLHQKKKGKRAIGNKHLYSGKCFTSASFMGSTSNPLSFPFTVNVLYSYILSPGPGCVGGGDWIFLGFSGLCALISDSKHLPGSPCSLAGPLMSIFPSPRPAAGEPRDARDVCICRWTCSACHTRTSPAVSQQLLPGEPAVVTVFRRPMKRKEQYENETI